MATTLDLTTLNAATTADGVYVGVLHDRATGNVAVILNPTAAWALKQLADCTDSATHDLVYNLGLSDDDAADVSALIDALRTQLPRV